MKTKIIIGTLLCAITIGPADALSILPEVNFGKCCTKKGVTSDATKRGDCEEWSCVSYTGGPQFAVYFCETCNTGYVFNTLSGNCGTDTGYTYPTCVEGALSCAAGQYVASTKDRCVDCPSDSYGNKGTSKSGATSITDCYIPTGSKFSNSTGSGEYSSNCFYTDGAGGGVLPSLPGGVL